MCDVRLRVKAKKLDSTYNMKDDVVTKLKRDSFDTRAYVYRVNVSRNVDFNEYMYL